MLVRIRDRPGPAAKQRGRSWLLIKHRDFWSGPIDITEFAPLSVKSEGNFDDILAEDMPRTGVTSRPGGGGPSKQLLATVESAVRKILDRAGATPSAGGAVTQRAEGRDTGPRGQEALVPRPRVAWPARPTQRARDADARDARCPPARNCP